MKECPFCGGVAEMVEGSDSGGRVTTAHYRIRCVRCGAQTKSISVQRYSKDDCIDGAIHLWNLRYKEKVKTV